MLGFDSWTGRFLNIVILIYLIFALNGQADSEEIEIILADSPLQVEAFAADELARGIGMLTDAKVAIVEESKWKTGRPKRQKAIVIGSSGAKLGGKREKSGRGEWFVIKSLDSILLIYGDDTKGDPLDFNTRTGTLFGVYEYLERAYGVRWIWPGELGEVYKKSGEVKMDGLDINGSPKFEQRILRNIFENKKFLEFSIGSQDMTEESLRSKGKELKLWLRRNKAGRSIAIRAGHAFTNWYKRYSKPHPEWFAVQNNGQRFWPRDPKRMKFHISDTSFINEAFRVGTDRLRNASSSVISFSASFNDSGLSGFCMDPKCRKWDSTRGPRINLRGPDGWFKYYSLTDRYVKFWNLLAKRLRIDFPDKYVAAYAYYATERAPVEITPAHNVLIGLVFRPDMYLNDELRKKHLSYADEWMRFDCKFFLRPNILIAGQGYPLNYARKLLEDIRLLSKGNKLLGLDFDSVMGHWGTEGLNYYMLVRGAWDPEVSYEQLLEEYCEAFGGGGSYVKEFFQTIERLTNIVARISGVGKNWKASVKRKVDDVFSVREIEGLYRSLEKAERACSRRVERNRVKIIRTGLDVGFALLVRGYGESWGGKAIFEELWKHDDILFSVNIPAIEFLGR